MASSTSVSPSPVSGRIAPGSQGKFILGSLRDMRRKGQLQLLIEAWHEHSDVVRFKLGPLTQFLFILPEHYF